MRVLLISTYEIGRQPFGLASPAAWLRSERFTVDTVDCAIEPFPEARVKAADIVAFFLPMYTAARLSIPLIKRVKNLNPECVIVAYGLYAPVNEDFLKRNSVQKVIGGEFEQPLLDYCKSIRSGEVENNTLVSLDRQEFLLPFRDDLPDHDKYAQLCEEGCANRITGYTQTTRGCKHVCRHCPIVPVYNGRFRTIQRDIVLADVRQQVARGAQHITFGDPDFFNGPGHVLPIVEELNREFPDVTYDVTIKVEHLLKYEKHLPALKQTGCAFITSAVEAVDDKILKIFDKGHTRADFLAAVEVVEKHQLSLNPTFVAFTPWTTLEGYRDMLRLLSEVDLVNNIASVQLAIRLLIPAGSRLLEIQPIPGLVNEIDEEQLGYVWRHPDKRVDLLQQKLMRILQEDSPSRNVFFTEAWDAVNTLLETNIPLPKLSQGRHRATVPYLNEPWYC